MAIVSRLRMLLGRSPFAQLKFQDEAAVISWGLKSSIVSHIFEARPKAVRVPLASQG